ncbi:MAG TPA: tetratricopeptide repeat protein [Ramlibacter sp.]|jgi:ketosteroid isomerase-like protein
MSVARKNLSRTLVLGVLTAALMAAGGLARADEYSDVNQLLRSGRLPEALAKADQYLAGKPKDPQMRFLKGVIQTESGKAPDAIVTFTRLTEDYPELPEPYNNLAVLYAGQAQFDKARAALEMAIRTNPSYATAHENLGDVYAKLASQAYSRALQLDSGNTAVQPKLALIRELFSTGPRTSTAAAPAPRPGTAVAVAPAAATRAPAPAPTVVAAAPAPAPTPAAAPAPATRTPPVSGGSIGTAAPVPAPAAPAPAPAPAPAAGAAAAAAPAVAGNATAKEVEAAVQAWAAAWAAKDMNGYLAAYGPAFDPPGNQNRKAWEEERRARIVGKSKITVRVSDLDVNISGGKAVARFRQAYSADSLNVTSRKTLELVKTGERWSIVRESTGG